MKRGKRYIEALKKIDKGKKYSLDEAVDIVKETATAKFDETIEMAINLNIKQKHSIRDSIMLPNTFGKEKKVLVFARGDKAEEAKQAGADYVGDTDLIERIKGGWLDFDATVATPDMMREVGKLGAILGRRGLMPNPKLGTVTNDIKEVVPRLKKGMMEYRADKTGVVHLPVGKASMNKEKIIENVKHFYNAILRKKPSDLKGEYISSVAISSTMGPGIKLDPKQIV